MKALIVKHIDCEGPGLLGNVLDRRRIEVTLVHPYRGERVPDVGGYDYLVILGGPMGVYERDRFPFIDAEAQLARDAIARDVPVLGICLGSQIVAHALGAAVTKHRAREIGAMTVELTPEGATDPLLAGLDSPLSVFQWHGDTFGIPSGAARLASSPITANQAFRYGRCAYGFQFHIEVTPEMVAVWLAEYREEVASERLDAGAILNAAEREGKRWAEISEIVVGRFVDLGGVTCR